MNKRTKITTKKLEKKIRMTRNVSAFENKLLSLTKDFR